MPRLQSTLSGIKHTLWLSRRNRLPITISILESIFNLLAPDRSLDIGTVMLWAAFTLAFFSFLRCSELPNTTTPEHMKVCIKKSKTDLFRKTSTITIARAVQWQPLGIFFYKHLTTLHRAPCLSLRMVRYPFSHGAPWPLTYTLYLTCAVSDLTIATLTASVSGQPQQLLLLAYLFGSSKFLAVGAPTVAKGIFTSRKLSFCKSVLLWPPTTSITPELRT